MIEFNHKNLKIINADCMDIMKEYKDNYFDLAIVDPPYRTTNENAPTPKMRTHRFVYKQQLGKKPKEDFFNELYRISKNQIIWGANNFNLCFKGFIVWDKSMACKDNLSLKFSAAEIASISEELSTISKIFTYPSRDKNRIHSCQKPIKLYEWILKTYGNKDFKIIDTHLGSGSSAIASYYFGCKEFVGVEIDENYYNDSIKRIKEETAQIKLL